MAEMKTKEGLVVGLIEMKSEEQVKKVENEKVIPSTPKKPPGRSRGKTL